MARYVSRIDRFCFVFPWQSEDSGAGTVYVLPRSRCRNSPRHYYVPAYCTVEGSPRWSLHMIVCYVLLWVPLCVVEFVFTFTMRAFRACGNRPRWTLKTNPKCKVAPSRVHQRWTYSKSKTVLCRSERKTDEMGVYL